MRLTGYIYVADKVEGLILVPAGTLLDGNPLNNFLAREVTFNPGGILKGARAITIAGTNAYIGCDAGLVVVDLNDPKQLRTGSVVESDLVRAAVDSGAFRHAFVWTRKGEGRVYDRNRGKAITWQKKTRTPWPYSFAEWHGRAWGTDSVWVDVLCVLGYAIAGLRLASLMSALAVCLYARLRRTGRRRAHAPAD